MIISGNRNLSNYQSNERSEHEFYTLTIKIQNGFDEINFVCRYLNCIEHLDFTSMTRYDRWSKYKKYKYLWQINDTLNIQSHIFSLTSRERCFIRQILNPYAQRLKNYRQNFFHSTLHWTLDWIFNFGCSAYLLFATGIYNSYV